MIVAPFTGAWIEIEGAFAQISRVFPVAPFTGAWIEILNHGWSDRSCLVAPFTGAWIEMGISLMR